MKRRIVPFALILGSLVAVYACSSSDNAANSSGGTTTPEAGTSPEGSADSDGNTIQPDTGTPADGSVTPTTNPIEGITAAKQVADALGYADGPQWWQNTLYVSRPLDGAGFLLKVDLTNGSVAEVTTRSGERINGNSVDKNNFLISAEATGGIVKAGPDGGVKSVIAATYNDGEGGVFPFDNANDLVQHPGGTIFVTDPGYGTAAVTNHLFRILTDGGAFISDEFPDQARPNGIALSKDGNTLYVGVTSPVIGTKPFIRKYTVGANGTLTAPTKFAELPHPTVDPAGAGAANDEPDGLAIDDNGNVYVAWRLGINVYKADGTRYGAADPSIAIPTPATNQPTNVTFGRTDRKSLFITTSSGKIFEAVLNVPGLLQ